MARRPVPGAQARRPAPLAEIDAGLASKRLLNLNDLSAREELLPALVPLFPNSRERDNAARQIYYLSGSLPNAGAILRTKALTPSSSAS